MGVDARVIAPDERAADTIRRCRATVTVLDAALASPRALDLARELASTTRIVFTVDDRHDFHPPFGTAVVGRPTENFEALLEILEMVLA
jgi:hypothetical protein